MEQQKQSKEEYAVVLDFLPNGYLFDRRPIHKKTPIAQAMGRNNFTLLEVVPKKDIFLQPLDEIYIGEGKRDKVHHIIGKINVEKLTETAKKEMEYVVTDIVGKNEKKFVDFFNIAQPLSTRMHQIELIPGIGKKHMWEIIEERKEKPFESFDDLKSRVKLIPDPKKAVIKRIVEELGGKEKYTFFVG